MAAIDAEIIAYESMREKLETESLGKWVVLHDGNLEGIYASFEAAAEEAVQRFGRGPYMIRQIGIPLR